MTEGTDSPRPAASTMMATIGYRLVDVNDERALAEMPFRDEVAQLTGLFHTGALLALADSCATALCMHQVDPTGAVDPSRFPFAIQLSANLVRNSGRGTAAAEARWVHKGRTTQVVETSVRDSDGRLLVAVTTTHVVLGG